MIKIINKGNWTGEKDKIVINKRKKTVSLYDGQNVFKIKKVKGVEGMYEAWDLDNSDYPFCKIYKDDETFFADNGCCARESRCKFEAVAQLAFNLI